MGDVCRARLPRLANPGAAVGKSDSDIIVRFRYRSCQSSSLTPTRTVLRANLQLPHRTRPSASRKAQLCGRCSQEEGLAAHRNQYLSFQSLVVQEMRFFLTSKGPSAAPSFAFFTFFSPLGFWGVFETVTSLIFATTSWALSVTVAGSIFRMSMGCDF